MILFEAEQYSGVPSSKAGDLKIAMPIEDIRLIREDNSVVNEYDNIDISVIELKNGDLFFIRESFASICKRYNKLYKT